MPSASCWVFGLSCGNLCTPNSSSSPMTMSMRDRWEDVIWAMTTRMDPRRDCVFVDNTPIDYLDFASPVAGLGSKVGMDATHKWEGDSEREWGTAIAMSPDVKTRRRCHVGFFRH